MVDMGVVATMRVFGVRDRVGVTEPPRSCAEVSGPDAGG